jgi:DNA-binding NtrC family response regulator
VTELKMPGMTGIELLRQLRAVDADVAVIVQTDAADVKTAIESLKLGVYAFVMKPLNADELLITAGRALERRWLLIERRQHQQADGQLQEADRTTLGRRADPAQRDVLILVVEEDRQIRKLLQQIFDSAGYRCVLAGDGEEGLKLFRESRPSLVMADLGMPMVRGGESVRDAGIRLLLEIRQEDPNAAVIVASGMPDVRFVIESLKLGAYAFLTKPIIVDELLITAERALEHRQLLVERRQDRPT